MVINHQRHLFFHLRSEDSAYIDVSLLRALCTGWSALIGVDYCRFGKQKYLQILGVFISKENNQPLAFPAADYDEQKDALYFVCVQDV